MAYSRMDRTEGRSMMTVFAARTARVLPFEVTATR